MESARLHVSIGERNKVIRFQSSEGRFAMRSSWGLETM